MVENTDYPRLRVHLELILLSSPDNKLLNRHQQCLLHNPKYNRQTTSSPLPAVLGNVNMLGRATNVEPSACMRTKAPVPLSLHHSPMMNQSSLLLPQSARLILKQQR